MIASVELHIGHVDNPEKIKVEIAPLTILVGPNGGGKTATLRGIYTEATGGTYSGKRLNIVESADMIGIPEERARQWLQARTLKPYSYEQVLETEVILGFGIDREKVTSSQFLHEITTPIRNSAGYKRYTGEKSLLLDGPARFSVVRPKPRGDLSAVPQNSFQELLIDSDKRRKFRELVKSIFNKYVVLDATVENEIRLKVSDRDPGDYESSISREASAYMRECLSIDNDGDGLKAFAGIMSEVIAGDPELLFIDEPEAFLHPLTAYRLGYEIARAVDQSSKRAFIATHSSDFLMGCVQAGRPITIIRVEYAPPYARAKTVDRSELAHLFTRPLTRSANAMRGLFASSVVVCEGDTDRGFFQEVNHRLPENGKDNALLGIPDSFFLSSNGKQSVHTFISAFRKFGIAAAAIVDFDILDDQQAWDDLLKSSGAPVEVLIEINRCRDEVLRSLRALGIKAKTCKSPATLDEAAQIACATAIELLNSYGLFVVPFGEVESWLASLGAKGRSAPWLVDIFERMGQDKDDPNYVLPVDEDVWAFITKANKWLTDPSRLGID